MMWVLGIGQRTRNHRASGADQLEETAMRFPLYVRLAATRSIAYRRFALLLVLPVAIAGAGVAKTCCTLTVLHGFDRLINGAKPFNLVAGKAGVLYGVTYEGGFDGVGCRARLRHDFQAKLTGSSTELMSFTSLKAQLDTT